jgi:hypothetical protein
MATLQIVVMKTYYLYIIWKDYKCPNNDINKIMKEIYSYP